MYSVPSFTAALRGAMQSRLCVGSMIYGRDPRFNRLILLRADLMIQSSQN
jgi:hypothetical protein